MVFNPKRLRNSALLASWLESLFQASYKGLKVGAAAHMYRKKTGVWPRKLDRIPTGDQWQLTAKDFIAQTRGNNGQTRDILAPHSTIALDQ